MAEEALHGAHVVPVFEEVRGKAVSKRVAARFLFYVRRFDGLAHAPLDEKAVFGEAQARAVEQRGDELEASCLAEGGACRGGEACIFSGEAVNFRWSATRNMQIVNRPSERRIACAFARSCIPASPRNVRLCCSTVNCLARTAFVEYRLFSRRQL